MRAGWRRNTTVQSRPGRPKAVVMPAVGAAVQPGCERCAACALPGSRVSLAAVSGAWPGIAGSASAALASGALAGLFMAQPPGWVPMFGKGGKGAGMLAPGPEALGPLG